MRIAYVAPYIDKDTIRGGVGRKIQSQIGIWRGWGHEACLFALSPDEVGVDGSVFSYRSSTAWPLARTVSRNVSRSRGLWKMIASVHEYRPEIIYMRLGRYTYPFQRMFASAPVVIELNTDDINENRHRGFVTYWANRLTRNLLLDRASGLIAVSHEIAGLPGNAGRFKPVRVIANGIDLRQFQPFPAPANRTPVLTLAGSPGMVWHGVDKLLALAGKCPDLRINIVGYSESNLPGPVPSNVRLHGFMDRAGVASVLQATDVACGSLAMHRTRMQEASPLKVREAAAYGIPLILAYRDTDLSDLENECILQLPNTEDNLAAHAEEIRLFAYRMMGKRIAREAVAANIDLTLKEKTRLAFFEELRGSSSNAA